MHKSRIGGVFIDHPARSFEASLAFWAAAMGREPEDGDPYRSLGWFDGEVVVELQRLDDDTGPRVHLDIDTDDVEAEVHRLEALGAKRLKSYHDGSYWQMVDPGGLVFCVISPHTPDFDDQATEWP
ncbi:VOC family protein [Tenggerimyces flavus]|uniref:VOC family protein n=1 Tax=Tenggerimyces flavus TaxID=1708749 RepID=A0ABV7YJV9_9ACTN|nr:VOC family protein [Tenggerimyces flavus]MBM7790295.1 putative enzyme related to lactoylglutathione lyase [Tenggerimyces flavus]